MIALTKNELELPEESLLIGVSGNFAVEDSNAMNESDHVSFYHFLGRKLDGSDNDERCSRIFWQKVSLNTLQNQHSIKFFAISVYQDSYVYDQVNYASIKCFSFNEN